MMLQDCWRVFASRIDRLIAVDLMSDYTEYFKAEACFQTIFEIGRCFELIADLNISS
jgi:hypothetical protein